ncbi:MaoC family dehydratase [Streptosporangium algeriense]|uniref:MaoC family dehydratase n=1 Tax=Streptosporangium algeriense TaxID=1682748 RepID=A0ABW3DWL8_9ACTN
MAATVKYDDVETGQEIPPVDYPVRRVNLVMYAGASGDFNPIHWNERFAKAVGLPDVIAHGMFTMAQGGRFVTDWAGDPGAVVDYGVRFSSMVVVPDDEEGVVITVSGLIEQKLEDKRVVVALVARSGDSRVLSKARAVVQLA